MGRQGGQEQMARRADVYQMMLEGKNIHHILAYCGKHWGVRKSSVEKDMIAVRHELLTEFTKEKQEIVALHVNRYENLYRFYMDEGTEDNPNIRYCPETASKMLEKKEKLLRLHNPDVVINNNNLNVEIDLSKWSKDDIIKALEI